MLKKHTPIKLNAPLLPLIKWSGGKRGELEHIRKFYPKDYKLYVEPFAGGASVFFDLKPKKAVLNDIHTDLMNFYKQIQLGHGMKIYDLCIGYPIDAEHFYYIRDHYVPKNDIEKAFVFYYLRKTCFRGMLRYNAEGKFNIPFGKYKNVNFTSILDNEYRILLNRAKIFSQDYLKILKKYDNSNSFVFLDPPYDSEFTNYGFSTFGKIQHKQLADWFKKSKSKCLLIISETDYIKELYEGYIKNKYLKKYAFKIYGGRIKDEINKNHLIITNY